MGSYIKGCLYRFQSLFIGMRIISVEVFLQYSQCLTTDIFAGRMSAGFVQHLSINALKLVRHFINLRESPEKTEGSGAGRTVRAMLSWRT